MATAEGRQAAERLEHYWTRGLGADKIRWGQENDWHRCVAELSRHVADPEGLCERYHEKATGMTTPEHTKLLREAEGKDKR